MRKKLLGIAIAVGLALSLVAIPLSGCAAPAPTTPTTPTTPTATTPTPTTPTPTEEPGPKYGGILRIGTTASPGSIGVPALIFETMSKPIVDTALESLGRMNEEFRFVPWLATGWEEDVEAATITLHLREGVKFHDGTPFNAEAVKWNVESYKALEGSTWFRNVESVDVIDEYTVRYNYPEYISTNLWDLKCDLMSPTAFKTHGQEWCESHPVGTGPFKFVSWEKDVLVKFERFDDYWGGKPYLDGIEWVSFKDPMVEQASLLAGEIDAVTEADPRGAKSLQESGDYTIVQAPGDVEALFFDAANEDSPLSELKVRQAVCYAIDSQAICDAVGYSYWRPANQMALLGTWYYNPDVVGYPYNPEKARQLLTEAGYPNGFELTLSRRATPVAKVQMATAIQGYLGEVGIDVHIELVELPQMAEWWHRGGWDGIYHCWTDVASGSNLQVLELMFAWPETMGSIIKPEEFCDWLYQTLREPDFETRKAMYHQLMSLYTDKYCIIGFVVETPWLFAKYPYLHDDGLYEVDHFRWFPGNAWLDR